MHPGGKDKLSHGMHIHAVVDAYLPIDIVRSLWERASKGKSRLQVEKIGKGRAFYIGKYLGKGKRCEALAGKQIWRAFGTAEATRCKDIVIQNEWTQSYAFLNAAIKGFAELPWPIRLKLAKDFCQGWNVDEQLRRFGFKLESHAEHWQDGTPFLEE
jgi:hypothetical protein